MVVSLNRTGPVSSAQDPMDTFRQTIAARVMDRYCATEDYQALICYGIDTAKLDPKVVKNALEIELERLGIVNEALLIEELESSLHRFTVSDKKLDSKERNDAMQLVCKTRPGFAKGLRYEVAESTIVAYCRAHGVKVKTGLFSWSVP